MKIIGEGRLGNDAEKRDESARFVLGLGCVDVLNIGFEKTEEIDDFAGRVRKVSRSLSELGRIGRTGAIGAKNGLKKGTGRV